MFADSEQTELDEDKARKERHDKAYNDMLVGLEDVKSLYKDKCFLSSSKKSKSRSTLVTPINTPQNSSTISITTPRTATPPNRTPRTNTPKNRTPRTATPPNRTPRSNSSNKKRKRYSISGNVSQSGIKRKLVNSKSLRHEVDSDFEGDELSNHLKRHKISASGSILNPSIIQNIYNECGYNDIGKCPIEMNLKCCYLL